MKCEKCGGLMKKFDHKTMKCEECGATKKIEETEVKVEKEKDDK